MRGRPCVSGTGRPGLAERSRILKEKEKQRRLEQGGGSEVTGSNVDAKELANRQEFARGVSAWDFNMEQMRMQADLEILPPVSEEMELTMSGGHGQGAMSGGKLPVVKEAKEEKASSGEGGSGGGGGGANGAAGEPKRQPTKTKGRFDVYEEDDYGVDDGATSTAATTPAATPSALERTSTMERTATIERTASTASTDSVAETRNVPAAAAAAAAAKGPQGEATVGSPRAASSSNPPTASKEAAAGAASRKGRFSIMREEVSSEGDTRQAVPELKAQPVRTSQHGEVGGGTSAQQTTQLMQVRVRVSRCLRRTHCPVAWTDAPLPSFLPGCAAHRPLDGGLPRRLCVSVPQGSGWSEACGWDASIHCPTLTQATDWNAFLHAQLWPEHQVAVGLQGGFGSGERAAGVTGRKPATHEGGWGWGVM